MDVLTKSRIRAYCEENPQARASLMGWYSMVKSAEWRSTHDVRQTFRTADFVGNNRVIFDIANNRYRVVAHVLFQKQRVFVRFIGTHKQYDNIDPSTV